MVMVVDIGNSALKYYVMQHQEKGIIYYHDKLWQQNFLDLLTIYKPKHLYFCSVSQKIERILHSIVTPYAIDIHKVQFNANIFGFENKVGEHVGIDRLVNGVYAQKLIDKAPFLIIDAGTAITFDVFDEHQDFIGGMIAPGYHMLNINLEQADALHYTTIVKNTQVQLVQQQTTNALQHGMLTQFIGGYKYAVSLFESLYGIERKHIITGGDGGLLASQQHPNHIYCPYLTLLSLASLIEDGML